MRIHVLQSLSKSLANSDALDMSEDVFLQQYPEMQFEMDEVLF